MSTDHPYQEKELLQHMAKGDEQAFQAVFDHHRNMVYAKALHFMKTPALAEDILQEVFLRIWQHRAKLAAVENFKAYINTISRNLIYSHFRKMAGNTLLLERLERQSPHGESPVAFGNLEAKELEDALQAALDLLTRRQRKIFELSRLQGLSHAEIATALDMQRDTVKKHITDALRTIRTHLHHFPSLVQTGILLYMYIK